MADASHGETAAPERPYEARDRPSRGRAWLSGDMVSKTNRVSTFGKRRPLHAISCLAGQVTVRLTAGRRPRENELARRSLIHAGQCRRPVGMRWATWIIPSRRSGTCRAQAGLSITGTYVTTLECITGNAGSDQQDGKVGSSTDACRSWRSRRSSPRPGKPVTWQRAAVC